MRWGLLTIVFLLTVPLALGFTISVTPEQQTIIIGETAEFGLSITHDSDKSERFDVFSSDIVWDIRTADTLNVGVGSSLTTTLFIRPLYITPGIYTVPLSVRMNSNNEIVKKTLLLDIQSDTEPTASYLPAIRGTVDIPEVFDPRETIMVVVNLENQNSLNLLDVDVKVRSNVLNADYKTSLESFQRKKLNIEIPVDRFVDPQRDLLKVSVFAHTQEGDTYQFDLAPEEFDILPFSLLDSEVEESPGMLKTVRVITLTNNGNIPRSETYRVKIGWFEKFFTKTESAVSVDDGFLVWDIGLDPQQQQKIVVTTNYWSIVVFLAIICLLFFTYYIFRSPIVLRKGGSVVTTREGGIAEIEVKLHVSNRGRRPISNVRIIDLVPRFCEFMKGAGYIAPASVVRHQHRGSVVKWELPGLDPGGDLFLSYRVRSRYKILGGVKLPAATAKFEKSPGREQTVKSNVGEVGFR